MADDSKDLTVSFGAFSCRVTGFDDPMPLLTRVVEYFQDLSGKNPDFGTVPLKADPGDLSAFASAETGQAVAVSNDDAGVVLKKVPEPVQASGDFDFPEPGALPDDASWEDYEVGSPTRLGFAGFTGAQAKEPSPGGDDAAKDVLKLGSANAAPVEQTSKPAVARSVEPTKKVEPTTVAKNPAPAQQKPADAPAPLRLSETPAVAPEPVQPKPIPTAPQPVAGKARIEAPIHTKKPALILEPTKDILSTEKAPVSLMQDETSSLDEEEAAIDRMLTKSRQSGKGEPELAAGNPLVRLRQKVETQKTESEPVKPGPDAEPLRLDPAPIAKTDPKPVIIAPREAEVATAPFRLDPVVPQTAPDDGVLKLVPTPPEPVAPPKEDAPTEIREFAASMGAQTLPELLEASAAYVTIVNGQSTFSRREIFDLFDTLNGDNRVSFEARIKTLSRLLRTGVLERSEDGSFSMSRAARAQYEDRASA